MPSKAKAAKKAEEEAKRQDELQKRAQDAAEKQYRQHERERAVTERSDKGKREQEQQHVMLERDRLAKERANYQALGEEKEDKLRLALRECEKYNTWSNIIVDSWLPDVDSEGDINAFLSTCAEEEVPATEDDKRDLDVDLGLINQAYDLSLAILLARDRCVAADACGDAAARERMQFHNRNLSHIYEVIQRKLDRVTANLLQFLDQYVDRDEETGITLCRESRTLRYGLWAGDRRPRHRGIDFRDLGVSIGPKEGAYLPKAMDLVKDRGIRVLQLHYDPLSRRVVAEGGAKRGTQYHALGCVLMLEVLQYPKVPVPVKEWTLRHETALAHALRTHPYPPVHSSETEGAKPIKVSFVVPPCIVVRHLAPFIGLWNEGDKAWQMEGTSDFDYKRETRTVTFVTQNLSCMAIIQDRGFDVPYEEWSLTPLGEGEVLYTIEGRRRGEISDREVQILIKQNKCKVVAPDERELDFLRDSWHEPATLLRHLSDSGFNYTFCDEDARFFPDVLPKSSKMESKAYQDIAWFCSSYAFTSSRHNAVRPGIQPCIACEDPSQCLFRVSKELAPDGDCSGWRVEPHDETKWDTLRYSVNSCTVCQCSESSTAANVKVADGHVSHLNLYTCKTSDAAMAEEVHRRFDDGNLLLQSAVKEVLTLTRPLSFGRPPRAINNVGSHPERDGCRHPRVDRPPEPAPQVPVQARQRLVRGGCALLHLCCEHRGPRRQLGAAQVYRRDGHVQACERGVQGLAAPQPPHQHQGRERPGVGEAAEAGNRAHQPHVVDGLRRLHGVRAVLVHQPLPHAAQERTSVHPPCRFPVQDRWPLPRLLLEGRGQQLVDRQGASGTRERASPGLHEERQRLPLLLPRGRRQQGRPYADVLPQGVVPVPHRPGHPGVRLPGCWQRRGVEAGRRAGSGGGRGREAVQGLRPGQLSGREDVGRHRPLRVLPREHAAGA